MWTESKHAQHCVIGIMNVPGLHFGINATACLLGDIHAYRLTVCCAKTVSADMLHGTKRDQIKGAPHEWGIEGHHLMRIDASKIYIHDQLPVEASQQVHMHRWLPCLGTQPGRCHAGRRYGQNESGAGQVSQLLRLRSARLKCRQLLQIVCQA